MPTAAQLASLKTAVQGDANLAAARGAGDHGAIAAYYNAAGSGTIWRPSISVAELNTAIDWAAFAALTALKQATYQAMTQGGFVDATSANVRNGFNAVFGAGATLTALTNLAQRVPTRFEALFAASQVSAVYGQQVSVSDIALALG
jgi:hypothetical protein